MEILFWGLAIFCFAFILHLLVWKICVPKSTIKVLLLIFFSCLVVSLIFLFFASALFVDFFLRIPNNFIDYVYITMLFVSLSLVYIASYSAIEADSPSLVVVMSIAKSSPDGLSKEGLLEMFTDDLLVKPRIKDLVNSKMIHLESNSYKLTNKGALFVKVFILFRKFLSLSKGG